jgi:hypothetical protein
MGRGATRTVDRGTAILAANDWAIGIRRVERIEKTAAARATIPAGKQERAPFAGGRDRTRGFELRGSQDVAAKLEQQVERGLKPRRRLPHRLRSVQEPEYDKNEWEDDQSDRYSSSRSITTPFYIRRRCSRADAILRARPLRFASTLQNETHLRTAPSCSGLNVAPVRAPLLCGCIFNVRTYIVLADFPSKPA